MNNTIIETRNIEQVQSFGSAARLLPPTSPASADLDRQVRRKVPPFGICWRLLTIVVLFCLCLSVGAAKADDHGNVIGSATSIGDQTNQISGVLNTGTDEDWFRFNVTEQGRVFIYTTGSTNTKGYLYHSDGRLINWESWGGASSNFGFNQVLTTGTYYLRVMGESNLTTGSYALRFERPQTAVLITGTSVTGSINTSGVVNYYKFRINTAGRAFIYTTGSTNTKAHLYYSDGRELNWESWGGASSNFGFNQVLATGTYYLKIVEENNLTGVYSLEMRLPETAVGLMHGVTNWSLNPAGDIDYFSFYTAAGSVKIESSGPTNTKIDLYRNDGSGLASISGGGSGTNFSLTRTLEEGLYYFRVVGENNVTGNYQLTLNLPGKSSGQSYHDEAISSYNHYNSLGQTDLAYAMFYYFDGIGHYLDFMDAGDEGNAVAYYFWYFSAYYYHYYLASGSMASSVYFYNYYQALGYYYYCGMKLGDYELGGSYYNTYITYAIDYYNHFKAIGYH